MMVADVVVLVVRVKVRGVDVHGRRHGLVSLQVLVVQEGGGGRGRAAPTLGCCCL